MPKAVHSYVFAAKVTAKNRHSDQTAVFIIPTLQMKGLRPREGTWLVANMLHGSQAARS